MDMEKCALYEFTDGDSTGHSFNLQRNLRWWSSMFSLAKMVLAVSVQFALNRGRSSVKGMWRKGCVLKVSSF